MLYKKNSEKELSRELFRNPTCEYRGTPFWAWNSYLEKDELSRQIDVFKEMGLGGFHMHVRTGLENEYMGSEYLELTDSCVEKAKSEEMLAWLDDEDRWPSGGAGGIVTKDHKYRQRYITFTADCEKTVNEYRKTGGSYETTSGCITAYREFARAVILDSGISIPIDDIVSISSDYFDRDHKRT